ncbi:MAG: DUF192 domain-containing protein [Patescibacteria group bacterium]|nr:DUF192 domain-containing protein [Patescibacteria group bacterium]MDE2116355.1 DUF192 domain-containing protein [Patescibacteria group bacterium]
MKKNLIIAAALIVIALAIGIVVSEMALSQKSAFVSTAIVSTSTDSTAGASSAAIAPETPLPDNDYHRAEVTIAGRTFDALVADTDALQTLGLSGRPGLAPNQAMLFVFSQAGFVGFWMKDMKFPIDMLWLGSDSRITSFESDATPEGYPEVFFPTAASQYVVELPAGALASLDVKNGDTVSIVLGK